MTVERNEIRTGLLVVLTLAAFVAVVIYLGSPGVFVPEKTYRVYFDNAAALKPGAEVLLAGRKIGRVKRVSSPVPEKERPDPKLEALVEVHVDASALLYQRVKVVMAQPSLLGELMIDFTNGEEASGLAPDKFAFIGERPKSLSDAVPTVLNKIDPVLQNATATFASLQKTADNLTKITGENSDLPKAFSQFRQVGTNLARLTSDEGSLHRSLANVEQMTGPEGKLGKTMGNLQTLTGDDGPLAKTLANAEHFTDNLTKNKDLGPTFSNFRQTSERLNDMMKKLSPQFTTIGSNLEAASETVKTQPWRLIWPSTKKYEGGQDQPAATPTSSKPPSKKTAKR
ncbi:MAG: Mammalian cell entry related domain protein [Verrucomicrobiaceae bacterium]|nr:Mammalian cell entry related domain protein [Verrucomicrobiaceae bacterium]